MNALLKKVENLEAQVKVHSGESYTVVGLVCPKLGHTHSIVKYNSKWIATTEEPSCYLASKMEKVLTSDKRFVVVIGGRGSGKSVGIVDVCLIDAKDTGAKTYCLREFQASIKNSVHSLIKAEIGRLEFEGFDTQQNSIKYNNGDAFEFSGLARSVDSIKSAHGFKRFAVEEAQFISQASLTTLTPTARNSAEKGLPRKFQTQLEEIVDGVDMEGVSIIFAANPASSEDAFSQRFIVPFQDSLDRDGFYEDDLHLIVVMNYDDNPWYDDSGLEEERLFDLNNKDRATYDHIWKGGYNDSVENSLIKPEWFDACIDAHKKIGFKATGAKIGAHDPSDEGSDSKGYAARHGSVVYDVQEKPDGDVNEGGDWAAEIASSQGLHHFYWDGDGMGVGLKRGFGKDFIGTHTKINMFRGSESPDRPKAIYEPTDGIQNQRSNEDTFRNKRAQNYWELKDRIYRTYRQVEHNEYQDPDKLISFSSDIKLLKKLRAEVCRIPVKHNGNGKCELYTKAEMLSKFKIKSPNLADSVMMLMRHTPREATQVRLPQPIKPMGR